jgi:dTDP-4-amino-4,6-dideoxy-D-galactose acyltransferase
MNHITWPSATLGDAVPCAKLSFPPNKMRKLFVFPSETSEYAKQLHQAWKHEKTSPHTTIEALRTEHLNETDIVVSAGLPPSWLERLSSRGIVHAVFGPIHKWREKSDLVVDFKAMDERKSLAGDKFCLCSSPGAGSEVLDALDLVRSLDWDTNFFGFNIALLTCRNLTPTIYNRVRRFVDVNNVKLLQFLCNCHCNTSVRTAEDKGFRFTDIRLKYTRDVTHTQSRAPSPFTFGKASIRDIPALRDMVGDSYRDSRYYFDRAFPLDRVREFYRNWIEKGVLGTFDHECWCLFHDEKPISYCTLRFEPGCQLEIGLLGVDPHYRGKGLGGSMISLVMDKLYARGLKTINVVTQGRNYSAQRLYQKAGFKTKHTQLWYHKWMQEADDQ